jgi:biotin carboxyl carrier protein
MKRRIEGENGEFLLDFEAGDELVRYQLTGERNDRGELLVTEVSPGVFSILREGRSLVARVARRGDEVHTWVNGKERRFRVSDPRDRAGDNGRARAKGPQEVHAPMPGKVVKLLVKEGDTVAAGAGLIVVEAMKMQNEMKAAKAGRVARVLVEEGATVTPGDALLVIE